MIVLIVCQVRMHFLLVYTIMIIITAFSYFIVDHEKIIGIYNETKKKDYTKRQHVRLFLKLTKSKNIDEIVKILGLKNENFRKRLEALKKLISLYHITCIQVIFVN
jgi:uncharacterized Fe-S cluster-containing radical SAM superfamily protein